MALRKCPKCEINYILDDKELCSICIKELKSVGRADDEGEICPLCGEREVVPGKEYCKECLLDMRKLNSKRHVHKELSLEENTIIDTIDDEVVVDDEIAVDDEEDADEEVIFEPGEEEIDADSTFFIDADEQPVEEEEDELDGFTTVEELEEEAPKETEDE